LSSILPLIGPDGTGKTALAHAIAAYVQRRDGLGAPPLRVVPTAASEALVVDVRGPRGFYQLVDFASAAAEDALLGASPFQGALLVVSAVDSVQPGTQRSLQHAREVGLRRIVVALSKHDLVEDPELLDLVTMEIREQLTKYELDGGEQAPIVPVAALAALHGDDRRMSGVAQLVDAVAGWI
jgi:elongation factor Tu